MLLTTEEAIALETRYGAQNYAPTPVVLTKGEGVYVWDVEGKRYLDFLGGVASVSQGHCHPKILAALVEQAGRLTLPSRAFYSDRFGLFAKKLTELVGFDRALVMNTGVEAVETAIKLCRKWGYEKKGIAEDQAKIVVCSDNFHGRTVLAVSASTNPESKKNFGPFVPNFVVVPFGDKEALSKALADRTVAAFLIEPIQGEGGVNVPPDGYLKFASELCKSAEVLFVADEIQTGLGRTGRLLACDYEGVKPDVLLLGKALSGGFMPISAVLADDKVMLCFKPGDHGSTFGGNPLACSVAMAALDVIQNEQLIDNAFTQGLAFRQGLADFKLPFVREIRGKGLLNAIVVEKEVTAAHLCDKLKEAGLLAKPARPQVIRFAPPLVISTLQVQEALDCFRRAFKS